MTISRRLAWGALALGLAAPLAGSPFRSARGRINIEETARLIADGEDHVAPLDLAAWIRDRKPGLRVIDLRSPAEFSGYAIPTAANLPIATLARASFAAHETVALYSEGGAHAGQAWVLLKALGVAKVLFISGGLVDWYVEVMTPRLPANASPEERHAFEAKAELSRYFGGEPQTGSAAPAGAALCPPSGQRPPPRLADIRRRGC